MKTPFLLRFQRALLDRSTVVRDGALLVRGGRIEAVARSAGEASRLGAGVPVVEHAVERGAWVTPGLVDAHAHLELTAVGPLSAAGGFGAWVERVLEARARWSERDLRDGVLAGVAELAASGTTAVGDIDTAGIAAGVLAAGALPALVYREALDAQDAGRTTGALASVTTPLERPPALGEGLSPHAPFTVSPGLFRGLGRLARRRALPVTIHWSETAAEVEYLRTGAGPLAARLGPSPGRAGLDLIEAAGLLGPATSLVHGNLPAAGEAERLARAGSPLVHCPGTHAHFDREPFPWTAYRDAGVTLALGTDSLASNDGLDMRREMARLARAHPELAPAEVWEAATAGGAAALGHAGRMGALLPGHRADLCVWELGSESAADALEELVVGLPRLRASWAGGAPLGPA